MEYKSPEEILAPLNEQQRLAAAQIDGSLLILAGPGSGKTRVITHRIANMIAQGIDSRSIVALTFTNKAAEEMKKRIQTLAPDNYVWTSTFHRFCSRMLRQYANLVGLKENFTIYDTGDSKKVMKQAIELAKVNLKHYSADSLINQISKVKNNGITVEQFQPRVGHSLDGIVAKVYPEYQNLLKLANAVDFDDLLLLAVDLLRHSPDLREALDRRFAYMMVDEYQDTNLAQYQLIRLLNHTFKNLAVTGDPDQSIYGWRGANISNILQFETDFSNTNVVRLEQNYRSTPNILNVADQLIQNNSRRKKKSLFTENADGEQVRLVAYPSPRDEAADIADSIALAVSQGNRQPKDFAILYRTNYLSRQLEHALGAVGLPYQIVNGSEFYQRKEIKDVMGYLNLLNNPQDNVAFERIVNIPSRKIGKVTLTRLRNYAVSRNLSMLEAARAIDDVEEIKKAPSAKIAQFVAMIDELAEHVHDPVAQIIRTVLKETGYQDWLTVDGSDEGFERSSNVDELVVAADEFDQEHPEDGGLESYLEQSALVAATDVWDADNDYVTLMTLHAAKGLEFPSVYIIGLEDGILPHERSATDDEQVEEERRLLFVGITRAEESLQVSRCQNRFRKGTYWPAIPSRFLMELPRHEMKIFEPVSQGFYDGSHADSISNLDPWGDDLPSIDVNAEVPDVQVYKAGEKGDSPSDFLDNDFGTDADVVREPKSANDYEFSVVHDDGTQIKEKPAAKPKGLPEGFPRLMTGAELEARQHSHIRLHPEKHEVGMVVEHSEYGIGTIVDISGGGAKKTGTIDFETLGRKKFRLAFVNLRLVDA
jgi:DNA helicase-2/ATP-dependent DNA helicase PcrA